MEARDDDKSGNVNSQVTFELTNSSLPFAINGNSGKITINGSLEARTYEIEVRVTDGGTPSLNSTGTFTLEVAPANNNAPEFEEPFEFDITENLSPSEAVFTFNVTDEDSGNEGTVNLTLTESNYLANFSLDFSHESEYTEGRLYLLDPFDHEMITEFTLTVEATDTGYTQYRRSSTETFTVTVLDVNDNSPVFTDAPYSDTVAEDRTDGYIFFRVSATDDDDGTNKELEFSLLEDFDGIFDINASSGDVSVEGTLHKATRDQYLLEVFVSDGGDPSLNDTTTLNITVDEVNDNTPFFIEPDAPQTLTLLEDTETGYVLLNVSVGDNDTGLAGQVDLSVDPSDSPFQLDDDNSLVLDTMLNYEVW